MDDQEQARSRRDEELERIPQVRPRKKEGLRTISLAEADVFQVDDTGRLYWDGKPLEYSRRLTKWQTLGAFLVGAAVVLGAAASAVQAYESWRAAPANCPVPLLPPR
jgi:hypothetical protein